MARTTATIVTILRSAVSSSMFSQLINSPACTHIQSEAVTLDLEDLGLLTKLQLVRGIKDLWILNKLLNDNELEVCLAALQNPVITRKNFHDQVAHGDEQDDSRYDVLRVQLALASCKYEDVRYKLANSPELLDATQAALSFDTSLKVREALFRNPTLSNSLRQKMAKEYPSLGMLAKRKGSE